jgi:hypothetical protein
MLQTLYSIPNWLLGAIVSGGLVMLSLAAYAIFRRALRTDFSADDRAVAMTILGVVATINSLLLAFSAVSVWESFGAAEEAVVREGNTIGEMARDLAIFGSPESREARELLRRYTQVVVDKEWGEMRTGNANQDAWILSDDVMRAIGRMDAETPRHAALLPEIWGRANEFIGHRRDRIYRSQAEVPLTLWAVVIAGTALTMLTMFVLPPTRFNYALIVGVAFALGLVFFFIIAMDRPFAGTESISTAPFRSALDNMARWDKSTP